MTYVYSDSTAVLGPLALNAEPHSYDLCQLHANRLTVPRGWEVVRVAVPGEATQSEQHASQMIHGAPQNHGVKTQEQQDAEFEQRKLEISKPLTQPDDDWAVLADVVTEEELEDSGQTAPVPSGFIPPETMMRPRHAAEPEPLQHGEVARRGHLRMLRDDG